MENTRQCIVTRNKQAKKEMLRLIIQDNKVVFDKSLSANGRGYYLDPRCLTMDKDKLMRIISIKLKRQVNESLIEELIKSTND